MAVRNFWVEANIDGRETLLAGGPRAKDGGMEITIYQRSEGGITKAVRVSCDCYGEDLVTRVWSDDASFTVKTER